MTSHIVFTSIEELNKCKERDINIINIKFFAKYKNALKSLELIVETTLEEISDNLKLVDTICEERKQNLEDLNKRYSVYKARFNGGVLDNEKYYEYYTAKYNLHYLHIKNSFESASKKQKL